MANTYTQLYIQFVFAVQGRQNLLPPSHRDELQKYITGIVQHRKHKMLAIYCMPDHTHILVGLNPVTSISDLVRDIKSISSGFINEKNWIRGKFNWQEGYGAFSYSRSQLDSVIKYILQQEQHHKKTTFKEEYFDLLNQFAIEYDERFVFQWIQE